MVQPIVGQGIRHRLRVEVADIAHDACDLIERSIARTLMDRVAEHVLDQPLRNVGQGNPLVPLLIALRSGSSGILRFACISSRSTRSRIC